MNPIVMKMLSVYVFLAVAGLALLVISGFFGGDHDADHDFGEHDLGHDGDADHPDSDHPDHGSGHDEVYVRWLSVKVVAAFAVAFGAGGAGALALGHGPLSSLFVATPCGCGLAWTARYLIALLLKQQCNSLNATPAFTGYVASVSQTILPSQIGQVKIVVGDNPYYRSAREENGERVEQGELVEVVSDEAQPVIVRKR